MLKYDFNLNSDENARKFKELMGLKNKKNIEGQSEYLLESEEFSAFIRKVKLKSGIELYINKFYVHKDMEFQFEEKNLPLCIIKTNVQKGEYDIAINSGKENQILKNNSIYLYTRGSQEGVAKAKEGSIIEDINILFYRKFFKTYFNEKDYLSIKKYIEENSKGYYELKRTSLISNYIINQILKCKYIKSSKYLYIQSKIMELISIILTEENIVETKIINDNSEDYYIVMKARSVLEDNLQIPPTIDELAKLVNSNSFKLKTCFRKYFNNTVYGVLKEIRMERAKLLMEYSELNIAYIANEVGYSNASHFAKAFKDIYGINPKEFREK